MKHTKSESSVSHSKHKHPLILLQQLPAIVSVTNLFSASAITRDERMFRQTSIVSYRLQWSSGRDSPPDDPDDEEEEEDDEPRSGMSSSLMGLMILFSDVGGKLVGDRVGSDAAVVAAAAAAVTGTSRCEDVVAGGVLLAHTPASVCSNGSADGRDDGCADEEGDGVGVSIVVVVVARVVVEGGVVSFTLLIFAVVAEVVVE